MGRKVELARSFGRRLIGLIGRRDWGEADGLWIEPCDGVHSLGMRFAIDVLLVNEGHEVIWISKALRPWRLGKMHLDARAALELPLDVIAETGTRVGDLLTLEESGARK